MPRLAFLNVDCALAGAGNRWEVAVWKWCLLASKSATVFPRLSLIFLAADGFGRAI